MVRHFQQVNIEKSLVCDGSIACDNRNDEQNCTNDGRFYCESGKPLFVIERKVCSNIIKTSY